MENIKLSNYRYKPISFLRCHSKIDTDSADVNTEVWHVFFEPDSANSTICATCGGNKVCIIEVKTGEVGQRYSADPQENFFTLAWTKIIMSRNEKHSIIAVGGAYNTIYFINPDKKIQVSKFIIGKVHKLHKSFISSLKFHPINKTILFCAKNTGDVHILRLNLNETQLNIEEISILPGISEIFVLTFSKSSKMLLAAAEDGLLGWRFETEDWSELDTSNVSVIKFRLPENCDDPNSHGFDTVDSVEAISDEFVAAKCPQHSTIYLWNMLNLDYNQELSVVDVIPIYVLVWASTNNRFMEIQANYDIGLLSCGDDTGCIWLYDINCIKQITSLQQTTLKPVLKIKWPKVVDEYLMKTRKLDMNVYEILIGKAAIHRIGDNIYIVAVTTGNTVCIWELTSE